MTLTVTKKHFAPLMEAMTELVSLAHHLETKSAKILVLLIMMTLMHVNRNVKVSLTISLSILNIYSSYHKSLRNYNISSIYINVFLSKDSDGESGGNKSSATSLRGGSTFVEYVAIPTIFLAFQTSYLWRTKRNVPTCYCSQQNLFQIN